MKYDILWGGQIINNLIKYLCKNDVVASNIIFNYNLYLIYFNFISNKICRSKFRASKKVAIKHISTPMSKQVAIKHISTPMSNQEAIKHISTPMSKQEAIKHISTPMSKQEPIKHISTTIPNQEPIKHRSDSMSKKQAPCEHAHCLRQIFPQK